MKILSDRVSRSFGKVGLKLSENSPHILFGAGLVGVGVATVLACRATLKLEPVIDDIQRDVNNCMNALEANKKIGRVGATDDHYKNLTYVSFKGAGEIGKLYWPAALVGTVSVGCLVSSHMQLTKRNAALTASLSAVTQAYAAYRQRVREVIGDDRELEIYNGVKEVEVEGEDGRMEIKKVSDPTKFSPYAKCFDETCGLWEPFYESNIMSLRGVQEGCQVDLRSRGHLFLNDVYKRLGIPPTTAGQVVGWVWNGDGDNFVDFGLGLGRGEAFPPPAHAAAFFNGDVNEVWLDFNVDGPIHTRLGD